MTKPLVAAVVASVVLIGSGCSSEVEESEVRDILSKSTKVIISQDVKRHVFSDAGELVIDHDTRSVSIVKDYELASLAASVKFVSDPIRGGLKPAYATVTRIEAYQEGVVVLKLVIRPGVDISYVSDLDGRLSEDALRVHFSVPGSRRHVLVYCDAELRRVIWELLESHEPWVISAEE